MNVDSVVYGDARFKRLAMELAIPIHHAIGCAVAVWHHAYQLRCATIDATDADLAADLKGFASGMVKAKLAAVASGGRVRLSGIDERIKWLGTQAEKSALGVAARKAKGQPGGSGSGQPTGQPTGQPDGQVPGEPYSPALPLSSLAPDIALPKKRSAALSAERQEQAERLWSLQEDLRRELNPKAAGMKPTDERLARVAACLDASSEADCERVLRAYAADAKRTGQAKWLNGETNWRPKNFDRTLGGDGEVVRAPGAAPPGLMSADDYLATLRAGQ